MLSPSNSNACAMSLFEALLDIIMNRQHAEAIIRISKTSDLLSGTVARLK